MSEPTETAGLIEKLEVATEGCVELDGLIAKHFREIPSTAKYELVNQWGQEVDHWYGGGFGSYEFYHPAPFSTSLDAGLDLIERVLPPGVIWRTSNDETQGAAVLVPTQPRPNVSHYADSEWITAKARLAPLALVIAIMRAHSSSVTPL